MEIYQFVQKLIDDGHTGRKVILQPLILFREESRLTIETTFKLKLREEYVCKLYILFSFKKFLDKRDV